MENVLHLQQNETVFKGLILHASCLFLNSLTTSRPQQGDVREGFRVLRPNQVSSPTVSLIFQSYQIKSYGGQKNCMFTNVSERNEFNVN